MRFEAEIASRVPETRCEATALMQPMALEQPRAQICEQRLAVQIDVAPRKPPAFSKGAIAARKEAGE